MSRKLQKPIMSRKDLGEVGVVEDIAPVLPEERHAQPRRVVLAHLGGADQLSRV